jgi:MarR family transcriptional regulator, lower aerobic nicotinate degradation pathway regulator
MAKDDSRFLDKPGHLIRRLQQIALALFLNETAAFGITPVQYSAMIAIGNHPGIDQTALCNIIAFDRSTIGDVVGRLEKKKLIRRLNGSLDRRTKSLTITPAGRRLLRDIEPAVQSTQRLILAPLKPSQRSAFMTMLKHLVYLNNEHSRAPLRPKESRQKRRSTRRQPRPVMLRKGGASSSRRRYSGPQ